ncbi:MAG: ABC transporter ATP-binding protein [Ignavibacteria bacterium]|nr:ABC transporter ATP-binding protein [Ignavibacteria bacterium]
MNLLQASNIVKSYSLQSHNDTSVLKNVSVTIARGEFVALIGPSGAGKSTLLHILGLLDTPDSGEVKWKFADKTYNGKELTSQQSASIRNKNIGFIFQFHHLLPEFSALENVMMPALIAGDDSTSTSKKAKNLLEKVGLSHRGNHKPSELSGGEQQRIAIARALINSPELIIADEPTGNLDTANAQSILSIIQEIRREFALTFVVATHSAEVASLAERILTMRDGEIITT